VKTSMRGEQISSVERGLSRASGTKSFKPLDVPGLKSWAIFTASLRDEDREPFHKVAEEPGVIGGLIRKSDRTMEVD
jgi:hypothetical protein